MDVDESAVEQLCRNRISLMEKTEELTKALAKLVSIKQREEETVAQAAKEKGENENDVIIKEEAKDDSTDNASDMNEPVVKVKEEPDEEGKAEEEGMKTEADTVPPPDIPKPPSKYALELGAILLEKQAVVVDVANLISQVSPLQETVEAQERNLNHVKSDITTDKTVCEVSGNFMSARDADERIAAHYAGKQYVGWKLVRDKFAQLLKQYGKYGPPPPGRGPLPPGMGGNAGGPPPPSHLPAPPRGGGGGGGGGGDRGWRGGPDDRGRRGGPPPPSGGGRRDGGGGRWERGAGYDRGPPPGSYDRGSSGGGGGGYDRGGGGGGRRGGGGYGSGRGSTGNWGRR